MAKNSPLTPKQKTAAAIKLREKVVDILTAPTVVRPRVFVRVEKRSGKVLDRIDVAPHPFGWIVTRIVYHHCSVAMSTYTASQYDNVGKPIPIETLMTPDFQEVEVAT